jgi:hypothetical protein
MHVSYVASKRTKPTQTRLQCTGDIHGNITDNNGDAAVTVA